MLSQGWIGPEGGSLVAETEHGLVEVRVPAGALDEPRLLTIEPRAPLGGALGPVYDLGPSGTEFSKAVEVGLVPRGASGLGGIVERRQVATLGRSGWERLPAVRGVAGERVGLTEHFSLFGLVEEPEGNLSELVLDDDANGQPAIAAFEGQVFVVWLAGGLPFECELHHTLKMSVKSASRPWSVPALVTSAVADHALCGRPNCVLDKTFSPWRPAEGAWSSFCPLPTANHTAASFAWTSRSSPDLAVRQTPDGDQLFLLRTDTDGLLDVLAWDGPHWRPDPLYNLYDSEGPRRGNLGRCEPGGFGTRWCELGEEECQTVSPTCCKPDTIPLTRAYATDWSRRLTTDSAAAVAFRPYHLRDGQSDGQGSLWLLHKNSGDPKLPTDACTNSVRRACSSPRHDCLERTSGSGQATPYLTQLPPRPETLGRPDPRTAPLMLERDRVLNATDFPPKTPDVILEPDPYRDPAGVALHADPAFTNLHAAMIFRSGAYLGTPALRFFPYADGVTSAVFSSDNDFEIMNDCMCLGLNNCSNIFEYRKALGDDDDGDGVKDDLDNCPWVFSPDVDGEGRPADGNPLDIDSQNGVGDACEGQVSFVACDLSRCRSARAMCLPSPTEPGNCTEYPGEADCTLHPCGPDELHNVYCVE